MSDAAEPSDRFMALLAKQLSIPLAKLDASQTLEALGFDLVDYVDLEVAVMEEFGVDVALVSTGDGGTCTPHVNMTPAAIIAQIKEHQ